MACCACGYALLYNVSLLNRQFAAFRWQIFGLFSVQTARCPWGFLGAGKQENVACQIRSYLKRKLITCVF